MIPFLLQSADSLTGSHSTRPQLTQRLTDVVSADAAISLLPFVALVVRSSARTQRRGGRWDVGTVTFFVVLSYLSIWSSSPSNVPTEKTLCKHSKPLTQLYCIAFTYPVFAGFFGFLVLY